MFTSERIASFNELDMAIYHYVVKIEIKSPI